MKPLKILFLAPHLSTGGMPAFLLKRIEALQQYTDCEIFVVEYQCLSYDYNVQRSKIIQAVGPMNFHTLKWENKCDIFTFIDHFTPDIVHIDEMSERLNSEMVQSLYSKNRTYRIIETCHDISFNPESKLYNPDAYAFCTDYHLTTFVNNSGYKKVIEFPIDNKHPSAEGKKQCREFLDFFPNKYHVINVGLWTPGKNQAEGIEIAKRYPEYMFHFIGNQAENFKEYWKPLMVDLPINVKIWGERQDVSIFMQAADMFMFNSINECNPIVLKEAISYGLPITAKNLPQYLNKYNEFIGKEYINDKLTISTKLAYIIPDNNTSKHFALNHVEFYEYVLDTPIDVSTMGDHKIISHFVKGPFVEITGTSKSNFRVEFWDNDKLIHHNTVKVNHWVRANREYYTQWSIIVYKDEELVYRNNLSFLNERIYIALDSKSLGDTIAWIPYVEEFRKKHNCKVIVSTYKNELFETVYPNIEFVSPGTTVPSIYGMYTIGWFYDSNKEPVLPNTIPLQATACNILGLEYKEIKPEIIKPHSVPSTSKYVTIATNSTSGCKFWTRENWQEVITYLHNNGYTIVNTSLEENLFENCVGLQDKSLENTMYTIYNSDFFIGLSSGLSWLAWALDKKIIMISNFSNEEHEFKCNKLVVKSVCHGCWNKPQYKFDRGNWNWCPVNEGTENQFICQKSITAEMVITKIKNLL